MYNNEYYQIQEMFVPPYAITSNTVKDLKINFENLQ